MNIINLNKNKILLNLFTSVIISTLLCGNISLAMETSDNNCLASRSLFKLFEKKGRTLVQALDTEDRLFTIRERILSGRLSSKSLRALDKKTANVNFINEIKFSYKIKRFSDYQDVYSMKANLYEDGYGNEQIVLFYPKENIPWELLEKYYGLNIGGDDEKYAKRGFWIASLDKSRIFHAIYDEAPVIDESDEYFIRLYFLRQGIHIAIHQGNLENHSIHISNMGGNHQYRSYRYAGSNPGKEISITNDKDKEIICTELKKLLYKLRDNKGINAFLEVSERDEAERKRMDELKRRYACPIITDPNQRAKVLEELNLLLDIDMEKLSSEQIDRVQQLVASLGYEPFYTPEKIPLNKTPNRPMDPKIYKIKQGDIVYIQYGVTNRDSEEEVTNEYFGFIRTIPQFGGKALLEMSDGTSINMNDITEISVDDGKGGHYLGNRGGMDVYYFLKGGYLERRLIVGEVDEASIVKDGLLKGLVDWKGIDLSLPVRIKTKTTRTKDTAWSRMAGEKVIVLEPPNEQNNGVFMYKRADGSYGDHDMADINRIYILGIYEEVAKLKSRLFKEGDSVVIKVDDRYYYGVVDSFYTRPFIGRRMVVKLDQPPDPEKNYVHVKFAHEGEAALVEAKNTVSKEQIAEAFADLHTAINDAFSKFDPRMFERIDPQGKASDFIGKFNMVYDGLFGTEGHFHEDGFDVSVIEEIIRKTMDMSLSEMLEGIAQSGESVNKDNPLSIIGSLLDEETRDNLKGIIQRVRLGISLFSGPAFSSTGTTPWVVKADDLFRVQAGQLPDNDFTVIALLRYFTNMKQTSIEDRVKLAYRICSAREKYTFLDILSKIYSDKDRLEGLSPEELLSVLTEYTKDLTDPDDILTVRYILGINGVGVIPKVHDGSNVIGVDFNGRTKRGKQSSFMVGEQYVNDEFINGLKEDVLKGAYRINGAVIQYRWHKSRIIKEINTGRFEDIGEHIALFEGVSISEHEREIFEKMLRNRNLKMVFIEGLNLLNYKSLSLNQIARASRTRNQIYLPMNLIYLLHILEHPEWAMEYIVTYESIRKENDGELLDEPVSVIRAKTIERLGKTGRVKQDAFIELLQLAGAIEEIVQRITRHFDKDLLIHLDENGRLQIKGTDRDALIFDLDSEHVEVEDYELTLTYWDILKAHLLGRKDSSIEVITKGLELQHIRELLIQRLLRRKLIAMDSALSEQNLEELAGIAEKQEAKKTISVSSKLLLDNVIKTGDNKFEYNQNATGIKYILEKVQSSFDIEIINESGITESELKGLISVVFDIAKDKINVIAQGDAEKRDYKDGIVLLHENSSDNLKALLGEGTKVLIGERGISFNVLLTVGINKLFGIGEQDMKSLLVRLGYSEDEARDIILNGLLTLPPIKSALSLINNIASFRRTIDISA